MTIKFTVVALLVWCFVGSLKSSAAAEDPPRVTTQWGDIVGTWAEGAKDEATGKAPRVAQFQGVPFAQPPVGELRFEKPQPWNSKWTEPLQAVKISPDCIQPKDNKLKALFDNAESEDCLYLNVWVPEKDTPEERLPVMVWFHGGGFAFGSGGWFIYNGRILAASQKVIVVTVNYRLAAFGFLYSGPAETDLAGNQGLWDQNEALKWVQNNIAAFGGDPNKVTIFGESAGAWSVSAQLTSPHSKGLFGNAIIMSGALLTDTQICTRLAKQGIRSMAAKAGCPLGPELKPCLKKLSVDQIREAFTESHLHTVYGDEFMPVSTREALSTGNSLNAGVNLLVGTMEDEASFMLPDAQPDVFDKKKPLDLTLEHGKSLLKAHFKDEPLVTELEKIYLSGDECSAGNPARIREGVIRAVSDGMLGCPAVEFGRLLASYQAATGLPNKVFGYHFKKASSVSFTCQGIDWRLGPCHADELPLLFGMPHMNPAMFEPGQAAYSNTVMNIFGTFAKTGSPPPQADTEWLSHEANLDTGAVKVNIMNLYGTETENKMAPGENPFPQCSAWTRMSQYCWDSRDQILTFTMMTPGHH